MKSNRAFKGKNWQVFMIQFQISSLHFYGKKSTIIYGMCYTNHFYIIFSFSESIFAKISFQISTSQLAFLFGKSLAKYEIKGDHKVKLLNSRNHTVFLSKFFFGQRHISSVEQINFYTASFQQRINFSEFKSSK